MKWLNIVMPAARAGAARTWATLCTMPAPLLIGLIAFMVYLYKPLIQSSTDNQPLRWGATLLAARGSLDFAELPIDPNRFYSLQVVENGAVRSHTPVGTALLAAPVFLVARLLGMEFTDESVVFLDSLAATLLTAGAVAMATHLARRWGRRTALFVGLALAFATPSWSTASRCLWQHTGAQFMLMAALCVLEGESRRTLRLFAGGAMLAFCFWCRPATAALLLVIAGFALAERRRDMIVGGGAAVVVLLSWIVYNLIIYGKPLGTYVTVGGLGPDTFTAYPRRLWGHLFSANRGMFVFSPILLLTLWPLARHLRHARLDPWLAMMAWASLVGILVRGFFFGWFGGYCYGNRYALDTAGLMLIGSGPLLARMLDRPLKAVVPWTLFALSAAVQLLGVARDYESWNIFMKMTQEDNAWNWRKPQILHCLTLGEWTRGPLPLHSEVNLPPNGILELRRNPDAPYLRYGFTYQEPWGVWIMPPKTGIIFNMPGARPLRVRCELISQVFPYDPTTVALLLNGRKFGELVLLKAEWRFEDLPWFDVPKEYVREGLNMLELRVNRACYPYASPAAVGAALNRVIVVPQ
jgi:hypothetical protein